MMVENATHESFAIVAEHAIDGDHLIRILVGIRAQSGTSAVIRADDGPELTGKAIF